MRTLRVSLMAAMTLAVFALPVAAEMGHRHQRARAVQILAGFKQRGGPDRETGLVGSGRRIWQATGLVRTFCVDRRWGTALAKLAAAQGRIS